MSNIGKFTLVLLGLAAAMFGLFSEAFAHNVSEEDAALIAGQTGWQFTIYVWLGAKHMVTGYDHLLFLVGVIFYLREFRSIATFVSLFALYMDSPQSSRQILRSELRRVCIFGLCLETLSPGPLCMRTPVPLWVSGL